MPESSGKINRLRKLSHSFLAEHAPLSKLLETHLAIERVRSQVVLHRLDLDLVRAVAIELPKGLAQEESRQSAAPRRFFHPERRSSPPTKDSSMWARFPCGGTARWPPPRRRSAGPERTSSTRTRRQCRRPTSFAWAGPRQLLLPSAAAPASAADRPTPRNYANRGGRAARDRSRGSRRKERLLGHRIAFQDARQFAAAIEP